MTIAVLAWSMGSLKNQILISMPHMNDPFFSKSVVYICEHGNSGAMGMIVNKNLDAPELREVFDKFFKVEKPFNMVKSNTFFGGPVHLNQGFIIHSNEKKYKTSENILDGVMITSSEEILIDISKDKSPEYAKIFLGCAVWDRGQLDNEILENSWIITNSNKDLIFHNHSEFSE